MNSFEIIKFAAKVLNNKKAIDIKVIDISNISYLCDYFLICNGTGNIQVKALVDELDFKLSNKNINYKRREGYTASNWVVLDYGDVIVHIFDTITREFYNLERLWYDGKIIEAKDIFD